MLGPLTATAFAAAASLALPAHAIAARDGQLQKILDGARNDPLYSYPTSLTRDIVPKPIHSHNDYWRDVPFYTALSHGCVSIEADVWLYDNNSTQLLLVGHDRSSLSENRTFDALYVQPILSVLRRQNPQHRFVQTSTRNGVYDTNPAQTLYLFVDVKTNGRATWPVVVEALAPLRDAGYLTTVNNGSAVDVVPGPVTVVGTGNTPRGLVQDGAPSGRPRDYFWDAPAADLATDGFRNVTPSLSPIASAGFGDVFGADDRSEARRLGVLNDTQLALLRAQVGEAHARGIKVRYWDTPGWPVAARNTAWRTLWEAGVDLLNADDLGDAAGVWER